MIFSVDVFTLKSHFSRCYPPGNFNTVQLYLCVQVQGGWQFQPKGKLVPEPDGGVVWSVQHPALGEGGALLTLRLGLYTCSGGEGVCRLTRIKHALTLLPVEGVEEDYSMCDLGSLL